MQNQLIKTLWDLCDMIAGDVDIPNIARAFIIASDTLAKNGTYDWQKSGEYQEAIDSIVTEDGVDDAVLQIEKVLHIHINRGV